MISKIYLIRHGETEWTLSGQHTGLTDIPLTPKGEKDAAALGKRLRGHHFTTILCSPLQRALSTCAIAGFSKNAQKDLDLVEWNYGEYEGLTTKQIQSHFPNWNIFKNGAPQGESLQDISSRADKVIAKVKNFTGEVAIFSHGHFLRVLAARWLKLSADQGRLFALFPSSISLLGLERTEPVIYLWNDISHLHLN